MPTFAHTETGRALDSSTAANVAAYRALFAPNVTAGWTVEEVPEGTRHGASREQDGTWVNPGEAIRVLVPRELTQLEFVELCQVAGGMTDEQLVESHEDSRLKALWIKFELARSLVRDNPLVQQGLDALEVLGYIPKGKEVVVSEWPKE